MICSCWLPRTSQRAKLGTHSRIRNPGKFRWVRGAWNSAIPFVGFLVVATDTSAVSALRSTMAFKRQGELCETAGVGSLFLCQTCADLALFREVFVASLGD